MRILKKIVTVLLVVLAFFLAFAAVIASPFAVWWAHDVWEDRRHAITVLENTPLYAGTGEPSCWGGTQIATLPPGSKARVRRIRYWKNCATVDVMVSNGSTGYILLGSRILMTP